MVKQNKTKLIESLNVTSRDYFCNATHLKSHKSYTDLSEQRKPLSTFSLI